MSKFIRITSIPQATPAGSPELQVGDILCQFGIFRLSTQKDFAHALKDAKGEQAEIIFCRNGAIRTTTVDSSKLLLEVEQTRELLDLAEELQEQRRRRMGNTARSTLRSVLLKYIDRAILVGKNESNTDLVVLTSVGEDHFTVVTKRDLIIRIPFHEIAMAAEQFEDAALSIFLKHYQ